MTPISKKLTGLSGMTVSKNCLSLQYALVEAINSLLPVCDEVVIGEMGSVDGTREMLDEWSIREPKVRVVRIRDWTKERGSKTWFTSALNDTREHLKYRQLIQIDADEILSDDSDTFHAIAHACLKKDAIAFDRVNLIKDGRHVIPEGQCIGRWVVRCGPSHLWLPSDEPHDRGECHLLDMAHIEPRAKIFHVGFMRDRSAFFAKAKVVLGAFFNEYDTRLAQAEASGADPMSGMEWYNSLTPYTGLYPEAVRSWLSHRGHTV